MLEANHCGLWRCVVRCCCACSYPEEWLVGTALHQALGAAAFKAQVQDWAMTDQVFSKTRTAPSPITWKRYDTTAKVVINTDKRVFEYATLRQLLRASTREGRLFFRKVDRFRDVAQYRDMLEGLRLRWHRE